MTQEQQRPSGNPPAAPSLLEQDILDQPAAFRALVETGPERWEPAVRFLAALPGPAAPAAPAAPTAAPAESAAAPAATAAAPAAPATGTTLLVGMGSSYMAACGAALSWSAWGVPARAELASDLLHYGTGRIGPRDRVVLISQSGASVELVKLADRLTQSGIPFLAVTNRANSPLALQARAQVAMELPPDHGVAVKSFGGTLLTLLYLGHRLAGGSLDGWRAPALALANAMDRAMPAAAAWRSLGATLGRRQTQPVYVTLARGPVAAGAREAALLGNEVAKIPAWYEEAGEFRHGIIELCEPGVVAALMIPDGPGAGLQVALAEELARTGALVLATAASGWAAEAAAAAAAHPTRGATPAAAHPTRGATPAAAHPGPTPAAAGPNPHTGAPPHNSPTPAPAPQVLSLPDLPEDYAAPLHTLPFQWLTLGWAEARGQAPGQFRYIPGVITDEGGNSRS